MQNYFYLSQSTDGWKNLACDEWLLDNLGEDELMLHCYINQNAVIIGRNQNAVEELNLEFIREKNVTVIRRMTGGGAVFADIAVVLHIINSAN